MKLSQLFRWLDREADPPTVAEPAEDEFTSEEFRAEIRSLSYQVAEQRIEINRLAKALADRDVILVDVHELGERYNTVLECEGKREPGAGAEEEGA